MLNGDTHKPTDTLRHFSLSLPEQECEQAVKLKLCTVCDISGFVFSKG